MAGWYGYFRFTALGQSLVVALFEINYLKIYRQKVKDEN